MLQELPKSKTGSHCLQRSLYHRHIQLITIGGAIGTGLFMGSGQAINLAGPSLVLIYMIIGIFLYFVLRAMGELLLSSLEYKSFRDFTADIIGPWAGFFMGWTYWFCWIVTGIAEVVVISAYIHFWYPHFPAWISSLSCVIVLLLFNLTTVRMFGELEFWFALVKILAIIALIIIGIGMVICRFHSPSGTIASISHLWRDGGFFPHGLPGFLAGFQLTIYAFVGIELVGVTAAEARDPHTVLPRAFNTIPVRFALFYILAVMTIMMVTPWREVAADKSPFVQLFVLAGLPAAAGIINFVVLTSAASSTNSGIYANSRMLYALAKDKDAPATFARLSQRAVPARGLLFSGLCLLAGAILVYLKPDFVTLFTLITTVSSTLFIFVWCLILCTYLVYRRKYPERHARSRYKMPGGRMTCWICLLFFAFILILLALQPATRDAMMATPLWFLLLAMAYRINLRRLRCEKVAS